MLLHFEDFTLDADRRELTRAGVSIAVEPQVFDLLLHLIANRDRVVSRDDLLEAVWDGRIVSESTLATRINAARRAIDDNGDAQRLIRTIPRKGFRFVGAVSETDDATKPIAPDETQTTPPPAQEVAFARTTDGVNIAMSSVGAGPPLLKAANWLNHLDYDWQGPIFSDLFRHLAGRSRFIRYDGRGNGLSDRDPEEVSFTAFTRDLDAVVTALDLERFDMLGLSQGAALAIHRAVHHPKQVGKLILIGAYARGRHRRGDPAEIEMSKAFMAIMRHGWGDEHSPFARVYSSLFMPKGTPEQIRWFADLQRFTTSAENATRIRAACDDIDVVDLLPKVRAPTLIFHSRHDNVVPFSEGRIVAREIPNARFVPLDCENHIPLPGEPAWATMITEIDSFLNEPDNQ